ncbi:MAG: acyltransferase [Lachnospiraceae bacterium]|nr:acyltransferase [Lachnospiraceae bacterium]
MGNRIREYDVMKAIAIVLVVLGHSYFLGSHGISMSEYISLSDNTVARIFNNQIGDWIYAFHMPLFMAISGALSCSKFERLSDISFKDYAISRFKRLMIPFYIVGIIYAVPVKFIAGYYFDWSLIKSYIWSVVVFQTPAHLWFLVTLFLLDIIFGALSKKKWQYSKAIFPVLIAMFLVSPYLSGINLIYRLFQNAVWFYIGLCFEHFEIRKKLSRGGIPLVTKLAMLCHVDPVALYIRPCTY